MTYKSNDLGPFAAFSTFTAIGKYSFFLGELEAGAKHQKLATTFTTFAGWNKEHGFKATLQYTRQKPKVNFFDKSRSVWVQQGALGLEYLYVHSNLFQFNASGYYGFIPSESVTIKNENTSTTLLVAGNTVVNSNKDVEIGKIVKGHQFGGWIGATYTPFKDTLFRAKLVCDYLKRDLEFHLMAFPVVKVYKRSFGLRALGLEILFGLQIRQKFKTKSEGMFSNNFFSALASLNYKARFITYF